MDAAGTGLAAHNHCRLLWQPPEGLLARLPRYQALARIHREDRAHREAGQWKTLTTAEINPEVRAGVGGGATFRIGLDNGRFVLHASLRLVLGIGGGGSVRLTLDTRHLDLWLAMLHQALHVGRATQAARTAARARIAPAVILSLTLVIVAGAVSLRFTRDNELEQWLRGTRFGSHPADWAGDLDEELGRLYQLLYQPRIALETREARNPRYGDVYRYRVLLVTFPAAAPFPGMFTLEATERWRTGLVRHDERSRTITEKDLDLDIGGAEAPDGPVYRLIYHDTPDGDRLSSISGTLYYRPFPDLTLPPIRID